ncbi:hypothetical protein IF1G_10961 [Cordyceps javanica]|uniref:Uncharacterized protein n=1 Tax=Cordyceps javanica TaxID=43265 RepID=A0A545ULI8_9HYPO|nr:hypothetical protein IF1G_10961 [Cordyceps javanica]
MRRRRPCLPSAPPTIITCQNYYHHIHDQNHSAILRPAPDMTQRIIGVGSFGICLGPADAAPCTLAIPTPSPPSPPWPATNPVWTPYTLIYC